MLGGLAVLILTSPGWPVFRDSFFDPEVFADSFPDVLKAFWLDIRIFLVVEVVVLVLGLAVALVRTVKLPALFPLRVLAIVYTDVFRGIPTILLVYLIGFGVPAIALGTPRTARSHWTGCQPTPSSSAASRSRSPTAPTSRRSTAPGSTRSIPANAMRRWRSASPSAPRCAT